MAPRYWYGAVRTDIPSPEGTGVFHITSRFLTKTQADRWRHNHGGGINYVRAVRLPLAKACEYRHGHEVVVTLPLVSAGVTVPKGFTLTQIAKMALTEFNAQRREILLAHRLGLITM
jgi:hypothetical protein